MPRNPFREPEQERNLDRDRRERDRDVERERPSWRDIDKIRDRSPHSDQARPLSETAGPRSRVDPVEARREAAGAMEALFSRPTAPSDGAEGQLLRAATPLEREGALRQHVSQHGTPHSPAALLHVLDVRDEGLVAQVLGAIAAGAPEWSPEERERGAASVKARAFTLVDPTARLSARQALGALRQPPGDAAGQ